MKPYYEEDGVTIYHGDCREVLPLVQADVLVTDPPYGIGASWTSREMIGTRGSSRLWGKGETWDDAPVSDDLLALATSMTRQAIVWGGNYYRLPPSRCWLVWDKVQEFTGADAELAWTNLDAAVRVFRMSRIDAYQNMATETKAHPTQKPLGLMKWCLGLVTDGSVLDPFMGSGSTLRAAKDLGRKAIGIEIEERYCEIAVNRLRQRVLPLEHAPVQ